MATSAFFAKACRVVHIHYCAAGEDHAVFVWIQCDGQMLPMNKVCADGVPPVHWPPNCGMRMVLVKKMIFAVKKYQSIGVVHPIGRRCKVVFRAVCVIHILFLKLESAFLVLIAFKIFVHGFYGKHGKEQLLIGYSVNFSVIRVPKKS
jgi:hypothetical protein